MAEEEVLEEETEVEVGSTEGGLYNIFRHGSTSLQVCHIPASLLFCIDHVNLTNLPLIVLYYSPGLLLSSYGSL